MIAKKVISKVKDNKGNATYLLGVFFIVILLFLTYFSSSYIQTQASIGNIRRCCQTSLDRYVSLKSVEIYNSVKNSNDYTKELDATEYRDMIKTSLNLGDDLSINYSGGTLKYKLSKIRLEINQEHELKLIATVNIEYPMYFLGLQRTIEGDFVVESKFNDKF